jgi:hypothetical protein
MLSRKKVLNNSIFINSGNKSFNDMVKLKFLFCTHLYELGFFSYKSI